MRIKRLNPGYSCEFDRVGEREWYEVLQGFDDSNIYQTWAYDVVKHGTKNVSHFVLKKGGDIVSAAQARVLRLPLVGQVMAYVRWGPMWKAREREADPEVFRQAVRALRSEYVQKKGLILRLRPALFRGISDNLVEVLEQEGYSRNSEADGDRTLLLSISAPLEEVRRGIKERWRNYLNRAEKESLEVIEGSGDDLFGNFIGIYREMVGRKGFLEPNDIKDFRLIQKELPQELKMKIMLSRSNGTISNGIICSLIGNTGIYLFGATSDAGLKTRGAYLLQWKMIERLKQQGCSCYDLNGINPDSNPGTYQFKAGMCGRNGKDVYFVGQFDAYPNEMCRPTVLCGEMLRSNYRRIRKFANNFHHRKGVY